VDAVLAVPLHTLDGLMGLNDVVWDGTVKIIRMDSRGGIDRLLLMVVWWLTSRVRGDKGVEGLGCWLLEGLIGRRINSGMLLLGIQMGCYMRMTYGTWSVVVERGEQPSWRSCKRLGVTSKWVSSTLIVRLIEVMIWAWYFYSVKIRHVCRPTYGWGRLSLLRLLVLSLYCQSIWKYLCINLVSECCSSIVVEDRDPSIGKHAMVRVMTQCGTQLDWGVSNSTCTA
jgi:hypothetical protein